MIHSRSLCGVVAAAALATCLTACSSADDNSSDGITVLAAASLQGVMEEIAEDYTAETGVEVTFSFAGSQTLVTQLADGAPADVLATANTSTMDRAVADGTVADPVEFATNTLTLVVAPGNPKNITGLDDLSRSDLTFVRCASAVPCGSASDKVLKDTETHPVSEENSVTDVLGKVTSGQADVGLVYRTDVIGAGDDAEAVDFPESDNAVNRYPIARTTDASPDAQSFIDRVTGPEGRTALDDAGFGTP